MILLPMLDLILVFDDFRLFLEPLNIDIIKNIALKRRPPRLGKVTWKYRWTKEEQQQKSRRLGTIATFEITFKITGGLQNVTLIAINSRRHTNM